MNLETSKISILIKEVRTQLGISQEDLARELNVSFATINRWENEKTKPFRLARKKFEEFCLKKIRKGELNI
jgi:putative transcriptional regulator